MSILARSVLVPSGNSPARIRVINNGADLTRSSPDDAGAARDELKQLARTVASRISGTDPFAEPYHAASLDSDFERLTAEAQHHVELEVGFGSLAGPARAKVVDRSDWVAANIASLQTRS